MTESAALLVDEVLPREPLRYWVLSVPFPLRYLFATDPSAMGAVPAAPPVPIVTFRTAIARCVAPVCPGMSFVLILRE